MNSMQIKDKIRNVANKKNVDFNSVFRLYMYERFIERLAISEYKDNFILKGGFYLSSLFGIENRATMDIDTSINRISFSEDNIRKIIESIIRIDIGDNAILEIVKIGMIREEDEYGGYRITINVKIDNMRELFHIDIATGDPITPSAIVYEYYPVIGKKNIKILAYNIETVLAEKLESILSRVEVSSRIRDYYDIYLIWKMNYNIINLDYLRMAVKNTFKKRKFSGDIDKTFEIINNSYVLRVRWDSYSKRNKYANGISYDEVVHSLKQLVDIISCVNA